MMGGKVWKFDVQFGSSRAIYKDSACASEERTAVAGGLLTSVSKFIQTNSASPINDR
jgi:hypothetical protein